MIGNCILTVVLAALTWEDIRQRRLSAWILAAAAACGAAICLQARPFSLWSLLGGVGVGLFLLVISTLGKGVGGGDGWLFCVTGIYLGFRENLALLVTALFLAAGYAVFLLLRRRCGRKQEFAFLPFVLAAWILRLLCF